MYIPPPSKLVEFPKKMLFVTVGEEKLLYIPPPPFTAEFPEKELFITMGEEF